MPPDIRKFARVYYDDLQREYPEVYADDALLATWLRLLVIAEKMWPSVPELPRWVRAKPLAQLTATGLVSLEQAHCYRIRGLDAERTRRQSSARNAAAQRWDNARSADRSADAVPSTRRDEYETNLPPPPAKRGRRNEGTNPRAVGSSPRQNGHAPRQSGDSPRQQREAEKRRGIPLSVGSILAKAAAEGRPR